MQSGSLPESPLPLAPETTAARGTPSRFQRNRLRQVLLIFLSIYLVGGIISGLIFLNRLQSWLQPLANGQGHIADSLNATTAEVTADQKAREELAISKEKRINVLLLGIDQRDNERGSPSRTDTMLLATLDLTNKTAGLLSIPRDLYVTIPDIQIPGNTPGPQIDRINTAHFWGEWLKYPGGGPELAKRTVAYNLGIPVDYYARIDFHGFEKIVDALGGVTVNIEKPIYDPEYPINDDDTAPIYFAPGRQTLNGQRALQYVRTRYTDSDFGRSRRQQQVLMTLAQQAIRLDALPRLPSLIGLLGSSFKSDMPIAEMLRLGSLAKEIDSDDIVIQQIDPTMVTPTVTTGGAYVLIPKKDRIDLAIQDVLYGAIVRREAARIAVLSGTNKPNIAKDLATSLQKHSYTIAAINDADSKTYTQSQIIYFTVKPYTITTLIKHLRTYSPSLSVTRAIAEQRTNNYSADIVIIIGQDLANTRFD